MVSFYDVLWWFLGNASTWIWTDSASESMSLRPLAKLNMFEPLKETFLRGRPAA